VKENNRKVYLNNFSLLKTWVKSYRKNLFQDASLINIRWFSWGASSIYIQSIYKKIRRKNYLQKCMLNTGGVTHTLTLVTESKINILFENMDWSCLFCFPRSENYSNLWLAHRGTPKRELFCLIVRSSSQNYWILVGGTEGLCAIHSYNIFRCLVIISPWSHTKRMIPILTISNYPTS
jgi:F0F1-type ATP synthase gamma subunit